MRSVRSARRLESTDCTMFFGWFPPAFGSSRRVLSENFVAMTKWFRSASTNSPTNPSAVPFV